MDTINFRNNEFKVREIELPTIGNVLISTNSLNTSLLKDDGSYVSEEAIIVDEKIFYFVDDNEMELADDEFINLITKEVI